jgi:hypothetical protein
VAAAFAAVGDDDFVAVVLLVRLVAVSLAQTSQAAPHAAWEVERPPGHGA